MSADTKEATHQDPTAWHRNVQPRIWRTSLIASVLFTVGVVGYRNEQYQWWGILALFAAAFVVGENLELRLADRPPIPISFAGIMALARTNTDVGHFSWTHASVVIIGSVLLSSLCYSKITIIQRAKIFFARSTTYFLGLTIARVLFDHIRADSQLRYVALISALVAMLALHEVYAWINGSPRIYGFFAAAAHASILAGGVLIGVGYAGDEVVLNNTSAEVGGNGLGISALVTCSIPLLVAWFAFSRYYSALRTYKQTIRALSAAPELGGIVAWGHADRVAKLAQAIGEKLDLDMDAMQSIETAAYMHTLGDAVLDTTMDVDPYEEAEAANITADIIRQSGGLDRVADIIDDHVRPYRGVVDGNLVAQNDIAASVLRVANDYDNISRREETWGKRALGTMLASPAATYNPQALGALEWVLTRDRYQDLIDPPQMPKRISELLNS